MTKHMKVNCPASGHKDILGNGKPEVETEPIVRRSVSYQSALEIDACHDQPKTKSPPSLRSAVVTGFGDRKITTNGVDVGHHVDGASNGTVTKKVYVDIERAVRKDVSVDEDINPCSIATFDSDASIDEDGDEVASLSSASRIVVFTDTFNTTQIQDDPTIPHPTETRPSPHPEPPNIVLPAIILAGPPELTNHRGTEEHSKTADSAVDIDAFEADQSGKHATMALMDIISVTVNGSDIENRSVSSAARSVNFTQLHDNVFDCEIPNETVDTPNSDYATSSLDHRKSPPSFSPRRVSFGVSTVAESRTESFDTGVYLTDKVAAPEPVGDASEFGQKMIPDGDIADEISTMSSSFDDSVTDTARPVMVEDPIPCFDTTTRPINKATIVMTVESLTATTTSDTIDEIQETTTQQNVDMKSEVDMTVIDTGYDSEGKDCDIRPKGINSHIDARDNGMIGSEMTSADGIVGQEMIKVGSEMLNTATQSENEVTISTIEEDEIQSQRDAACEEHDTELIVDQTSSIANESADIPNDTPYDVTDVQDACSDCPKATVNEQLTSDSVDTNSTSDDKFATLTIETATERLTVEQVRQVKSLIGDGLDYLDDCSPLGGAMPESEDSSADEM